MKNITLVSLLALSVSACASDQMGFSEADGYGVEATGNGDGDRFEFDFATGSGDGDGDSAGNRFIDVDDPNCLDAFVLDDSTFHYFCYDDSEWTEPYQRVHRDCFFSCSEENMSCEVSCDGIFSEPVDDCGARCDESGECEIWCQSDEPVSLLKQCDLLCDEGISIYCPTYEGCDFDCDEDSGECNVTCGDGGDGDAAGGGTSGNGDGRVDENGCFDICDDSSGECIYICPITTDDSTDVDLGSAGGGSGDGDGDGDLGSAGGAAGDGDGDHGSAGGSMDDDVGECFYICDTPDGDCELYCRTDLAEDLSDSSDE